jgi:hypothetical protein
MACKRLHRNGITRWSKPCAPISLWDQQTGEPEFGRWGDHVARILIGMLDGTGHSILLLLDKPA